MTAGLLQATGCIISSDDDDDGISDGADDGGDGLDPGILFAPTWICPPDADTITFFATPVGGSTSIDETFNCDDPDPEPILYDADDYTIEALPEGTIGPFYSQFADIGGVDGDLIDDVDFVFTDDGGFFTLTWTIDGLDPVKSCADLGADSLAVDATFVDDPGLELVDEFPCEDGIGVTDIDPLGWPIGEYVLDISLIDSAGVAITDPNPVTKVFIDFADHLSDLGTVDVETKL
ncbi:MAG TPA: hypothetical protein VNO33_16555 [Kofleriaceae bacterium]|nr:hypothetical protein [Kofleriaceae bacterium]